MNCCKSGKVSFLLPYENSLRIKELMINFLNNSVQIQEQNNQVTQCVNEVYHEQEAASCVSGIT